MLGPGVPEDVEQNFVQVRCYLANLYSYCLKCRNHLSTEDGLRAVQETRDCTSVVYINQLNYLQQWMVSIILILIKNNFTDIRYEHAPPKVSDVLLLGLIKHRFFDEKDISTYHNDAPLNGRMKKCLKELAMRLS